MKKTTLLIMSSILCTTIQSSVLASQKIVKAVNNSADVFVGEEKMEIPAYNIGGYNYFKLRDIAYVLNNSPKQFQVRWNEDKESIELVQGEKYSVTGGELSGDNLLSQTEAIGNESFIYVDGTKVNMSAYNIDGYTYFKLRDLGENLNFSVSWDGKSISISKEKNQLETLTSVTPNEYRNMLGHGVDVDWVKTKQGREAYNEQAVKDFAQAGVSHVRVRITEDISNDLLNELDNVVNDCLKNGVIPVIAYQADDFKNKPNDKTLNKVVEWWSVIAQRYQNASAAVSFDIIIEVTDALNKDSDMINKLYENAVTEIRKTNPDRIVMISPRLRSDPEYLNELKIPTNHNGHLMAEWHFYASGPSKTNEKKLWTTGTEAEKDIIRQKINTALKWQTKTGIPTWVGAWMAGNYNDGNDYSISEQTKFAEFVKGELDASGIPFSVNSDTAFYDRTNNKWINDMMPVFNTIFSSSDTTVMQGKIDSLNEQEVKTINAGFNAKATLSSKEQCDFFEKELKKLSKGGIQTEKMWLRLNGGTISQKTKPSDWSEDMIKNWSKLQKEYGCKFIFVVNMNDEADSQWKFYNKLRDGGIKFEIIEIGNEQYLPKFSESFTGKDDEVTKRTAEMTPSKYISLCNEYIKMFESEKLPFYVQFAPEREDKNDYTKWNKAIAAAINTGGFSSEDVHVAIHLYERDGKGTLDTSQITRIRNSVNRPIDIAVTEFGVADKRNKLSYEQFIEQEKMLTERILQQLEKGDMIMNQVLYTDYKTVTPEIMHPDFEGITPKGKMMIDLLSQYWQ